jgi:tetratricopeptide (TPR) repeat protein
VSFAKTTSLSLGSLALVAGALAAWVQLGTPSEDLGTAAAAAGGPTRRDSPREGSKEGARGLAQPLGSHPHQRGEEGTIAARAGVVNQPGGASQLDGAWGRFQTGDYEGAIALLRTELASRPEAIEVRENLATALFALALVRIRAQGYAEAEKLLEESARLGNADAARTAASLKLKLGAVDLASSLFEDLAEGRDPRTGQPTTPDATSLKVLVDVSLRGDDLDRAEWFLDKLPSDDAFVAARRKRLDQKRAFARTQETVERGGVVEVAFAEGIPRTFAVAVAQAMEEAHGELSQALLGPVAASARLKAFLYPQESFQDFTGAPPWAGGLFDGLISIPVPRVRDAGTQEFIARGLARVARHETTHAYLYAFCGDLVPAWLGEGLAQRLEGRSPTQSAFEMRKLGTPAENGAARSSLDRPFTEATSTRDVTRLYAQSHLLVNHYTRAQGGMGFWRGVLGRACQGRENLPSVLAGELGEDGTAEALWRRDGQKAIATP